MRRLAWMLAALALLVLATAPFWADLPEPEGAQPVLQARLLAADGGASTVALPHHWRERGGEARYELEFTLAAVPSQPLYLFFPLLVQRAVMTLDGQQVLDSGNRARMGSVTSGQPALVPLPAGRLVAGRNVVAITLESQAIPGYLPAAWLGSAEQLGPAYRLRIFLFEHVRLMVMAMQVLVAIAVFMACLYRPREPLFAWMLALLTVTLVGYMGLFGDIWPRQPDLIFHAFLVGMAGTPLLVIVTWLLTGTPAPRWLQALVVLLPAAGLVPALAGWVPAPVLAVRLAAPVMVLGPVLAAGVALWGAWVKQATEARLLLLPLSLLALAGLHDGAVAARWLDTPLFLGVYYRPLVTVGIAVLLMRRLGVSLNRLDHANAHLTQRLAERERELERLHAAERQEAAQRVRDEERQRLTVDLHDGVGGQLASIIALAERAGASAIERQAREALDDLRVVVHSLDIGDRELPVALAGLRERLARQLKRLGITLEWSTAQLPEISGVTPSHALNVLRIVQEAVANATLHGQARNIAVRGEPQGAAGARIVVTNDGAPFVPGAGGHGLENMRRRARLLGGAVTVEADAAGGTRVELVLPTVLPAGEGR